jgi:hypothetical protein
MTPEQVLVAMGQPHVRGKDAFTYCTSGGTVTVRFANGRVAGTT